jgi:hypothetical protein
MKILTVTIFLISIGCTPIIIEKECCCEENLVVDTIYINNGPQINTLELPLNYTVDTMPLPLPYFGNQFITFDTIVGVQ